MNDPEDYYRDEDDLLDADEPGVQPYPPELKVIIKVCEGQMVPYAHTDDVREYQLYDKEGNKDCKGFLCSRCVDSDRARGYDWRKVDV